MRAAGALLFAVVAFGQADLTFEVASVKPSPPVPPTGGVYFGPARGGPGTPDPGRITWSYASMKAILLVAFDAKNYQINGPVPLTSWLDTERYDIAVTVPSGTTEERVRVMWQNLLAERFGLAVHHEQKEFAVEELVIGKSGSKLKETSWDAAAPIPDGPPKMDNGKVLSPGLVTMVFPGITAQAHAIAVAQPISKLAEMLTNQRGHPVVDKTGLTGKYDFTLDYAIDLSGLRIPGMAAPPPTDGPSDPGPDLAAAIQQQLGLTLAAGKAKLDVVVLDRINKVPTEN